MTSEQPSQSSPPGANSVEIRIENLHKSFDSNDVLQGINLNIHRGELLAIVGGSGSGKTVLLEHIIGNMLPDTGSIHIADHEQQAVPLVDITTLAEEEMDHIRRHWAVVFQRNALFSGTVFDNIALWLREVRDMNDHDIQPIAEQVLRDVGFDDPKHILTKERDELSGGMAKRVAIARALAMDPLIMFYDEPTTGLDPTLTRQIHELIQKTHRRKNGQTTLIITHDKDLLYRLQPRIVMLHEGKIFFDGSYEAFKESGSPIIEPYFELMPGLQGRQLHDW